MIKKYKGETPDTQNATFIAESADIIGKVKLGKESSVWYNATIRGDLQPIEMGEGTNLQDNAVLHIGENSPCILGNFVTVGHSAIVHGATVGDNTLIGMGAVILDDAIIGKNCLIGASALVRGGTKIPDGSLVVGNPAVVKRSLSDNEIENLHHHAVSYIEEAKSHLES